MGSGGGLLGGVTNALFGSPQTVDTPDYTSAAQQTSAANAANNRINQVTPYGNSTYQQTGTDQYGNPTYTMNTTAAPFVQNAINAQGGQLASTYGSAFQKFGTWKFTAGTFAAALTKIVIHNLCPCPLATSE